MADDKPTYQGSGNNPDYFRIFNTEKGDKLVPKPGKPDAQAKPTAHERIPPGADYLQDISVNPRETHSNFYLIEPSRRDFNYPKVEIEPLRRHIIYSLEPLPIGVTNSKLDSWLESAKSRDYLRLLGQYIHKKIAPSKSADLAAKAHEQLGNEYLQRAARFAGLGGYQDNYRAAMRIAMNEFEGELVQRVRTGILEFLEKQDPEFARRVADRTPVNPLPPQ